MAPAVRKDRVIKMARIMFFSLPGWESADPTLSVVRELVQRGHEIRYFGFEEQKDSILSTGAQFIGCDRYLVEPRTKKNRPASLVERSIAAFETTGRIDPLLKREVPEFEPDLIVTDTNCFWGRLAAQKYRVPKILWITSFAFSEKSMKYLQYDAAEIGEMMFGMGKISRAAKKLKALGYEVDKAKEMTTTDVDANSIVFTSRFFHPASESFPRHFLFAGACLYDPPQPRKSIEKKQIYIHLGPVSPDTLQVYRACLEGFAGEPVSLVLNVGEERDVSLLGRLPRNCTVVDHSGHLKALSTSNLLVTDCSMHDVTESLYMGIPMLMAPLSGMQRGISKRISEVGAGLLLEYLAPGYMKEMADNIFTVGRYTHCAFKMREDFLKCPEASGTADFIETGL